MQQQSGVLKIIVAREATTRGYFAARGTPVARLLQFFPAKRFRRTIRRARLGVAVRLCRQSLSEQPALAGIKHLNRLEQVLARSEWSDAAIAEGLMLDHAGRLIEGTMSNMFLVRGGTLYTPRLHRCGGDWRCARNNYDAICGEYARGGANGFAARGSL